MEKERVPLAVIYKQDGYINIDFTNDGDKGFEIYGFLKVFLKRMEEELKDAMDEK